MARWNELAWREDVYEVGKQWRERCFFKVTALFSDSVIWTSENFSELYDLTVDKPIYEDVFDGDDEIFIQKLRLQLIVRTKASAQTIQLAAELLSFIYLLSTRGTGLKTPRIRKILTWHKDLDNIKVEKHINSPAFKGIANPGHRFNPDIFKQWVYMVSMLSDWKSLSASERNQFYASDKCWEFADHWDTIWASRSRKMRDAPNQNLRARDIQSRPQIRHWLMFMLYPDSFERIISLRDKKLICRDLSYLLDAIVLNEFLAGGGYRSQVAIDRLLQEIRKALELHMPEPVDFYVNSAVNALWGENTDIPAPSKMLIQRTLQIKISEDPNAPSYDDVSIDPNIDPKLEGKPVLRNHYVRERDYTLRQRKLDEVSKICGNVSCHCCGTDGARYGDINLRIFEVHHHVPLSRYDGAKITDISKVSVLCANCHRAIHATNPPIPVEELRKRITP